MSQPNPTPANPNPYPPTTPPAPANWQTGQQYGTPQYPPQPEYAGTPQPQPQYPAYQPTPYANPEDTGSFGWAVLGFFIPLVGLILYIAWKDTKPLSAKKAGMGALVSVIANVVLTILFILISVLIAAASS